MAYIEFNALSTVLCGSFSAKVFLPEMDKLYLDDEKHEKRYPVLWLLHTEGGTALDWLSTPAEKCAAENGIFIIAPDVQHALCTNMVYGPAYEKFMSEEFPGICRNNFPISDDPLLNWIGGVGTGAYGALKMGMKYPEVFSRSFALDGVLDMKRICDQALSGEPTKIHHTRESLEAVFGDLTKFKGSENDLFSLAPGAKCGKYYITCSKASQYLEENNELADLLKDKAEFEAYSDAEGFGSYMALPRAVSWAGRK